MRKIETVDLFNDEIKNTYVDRENNIEYTGYFLPMYFIYFERKRYLMGTMKIVAKDLNITKTKAFSFLPCVKEKTYHPEIFNIVSETSYELLDLDNCLDEVSNIIIEKGYLPDQKILFKIFYPLMIMVTKNSKNL